MIRNFQCVNISSKDPKALAEFYRSIGAPVFVENDCYDGWNIGDPEKGGYVCCWDENVWGKSAAGFVTIVLNSDSVQKTYEELKAKGFELEPPKTAVWGGQELTFKDPDGNIVLIL
ncbi:VOC family protein [Oscillospiraceae bacterium 42-9]